MQCAWDRCHARKQNFGLLIASQMVWHDHMKQTNIILLSESLRLLLNRQHYLLQYPPSVFNYGYDDSQESFSLQVFRRHKLVACNRTPQIYIRRSIKHFPTLQPTNFDISQPTVVFLLYFVALVMVSFITTRPQRPIPHRAGVLILLEASVRVLALSTVHQNSSVVKRQF